MYGFLAINKPSGISSAQVTNQVRKSFYVNCSAGHAGTLDPLASGVLLVAVNAATHFIRFLRQEKQYLVDFRLGVSTTTYDTEGDVVAERMVPADFHERLVNDVLPGFSGIIRQTPPAYSALKYKGRPLYAYAREGKPVPLGKKTREVMVSSLRLVRHDPSGMVTLEVGCGPGTYMRSLAHDIGEKLGCGATMTGLIRLASSGVALNDCVQMPEGRRFLPDELVGFIRDSGQLLGHLPALVVGKQRLRDLVHGKLVAVESGEGGLVRINDMAGEFHGIGNVANGNLKVERLLPHSASVVERAG